MKFNNSKIKQVKLNTSCIEFSKFDIKKGLKFPDILSEDLAYLCGVLSGDGCVSINNKKGVYAILLVGNPKTEIEFYDNKLYFTLTNGVTYCLNASNSEIIWTKKLGAYVYKMDTDRQLLGVVGLKEIDDDKLFSDYTNQLQIIEARTGKELYCSDDPLTKGNVPINDPRKGLSNVVAQSDNIIFLADDTHFFSMRIRREN